MDTKSNIGGSADSCGAEPVADFDPEVAAIAAQPFLIRAGVGGQVRRHVPDFLLVHADRSALVNVKPASRLADPAITEALAWPGRLIEARGWGYEIWSGEDPVYLANLRFLAGYRRPGLLPDGLLETVLAAACPGDWLVTLLDRLECAGPRARVKAAALRLLWQLVNVGRPGSRVRRRTRTAAAAIGGLADASARRTE